MEIIHLVIDAQWTNDSDETIQQAIEAERQQLTRLTPFDCIEVSLHACIMTMSLLGNGFVIYLMLRYHSLRRRVSGMMMNLTASSLLVSGFCIPLRISLTINKAWLFGNVGCKLSAFIHAFAVILNTSSLVAMAVNRSRISLGGSEGGESHGRRRCSSSRGWIIGCWVSAILISSPMLFLYSLQAVTLQRPALPALNLTASAFPTAYRHCVEASLNQDAQKYISLAFLGVTALCPLIVMCLSYGIVARKIHRHFDRVRGDPPSDATRRRALRTVAVLVGCFTVCWLPKELIMVLVDFLLPTQPKEAAKLQRLLPVCSMLVYLHSATSGVLYCCLNTAFRARSRHVLMIALQTIREHRRSSDVF